MLNDLMKMKNSKTWSISAENITGEKGKGGMSTDGAAKEAARDLGQGWKVSPYLFLESGEETVLADYKGMGIIRHIWCVSNSERLRSLILRF